MAYTLSERASSASNLTAKNRVWGFFENSNRTCPVNRRQPLETRRKNRPTPTKTASGIPYWPSRDPIEEMGGLNLYGMLDNDGINSLDYMGLSEITITLQRFSDEQAQSLGFRSNSATIGQFVMSVTKNSCECPYPETVTGVTIEQPRGNRNLYGLFGSAKEYPIRAGTYTTNYAKNAPGGTEGFTVEGVPKFSGVFIHSGWSAASSEGCLIIGKEHRRGIYFDRNFLADINAPETKANVASGKWLHAPSKKYPNRFMANSGPDASGVSDSKEKLAEMVAFYNAVKKADQSCGAKTTIKTEITDSAPTTNAVPGSTRVLPPKRRGGFWSLFN